jgi:hypothetical protein
MERGSLDVGGAETDLRLSYDWRREMIFAQRGRRVNMQEIAYLAEHYRPFILKMLRARSRFYQPR